MGQVIGAIGDVALPGLLGIPQALSNVVAMTDNDANTNTTGLISLINHAINGPNPDIGRAAVGQALGDTGFSGTIGQPGSVGPVQGNTAQGATGGNAAAAAARSGNVTSARANVPVRSFGAGGQPGSPVGSVGPVASQAMANMANASNPGPAGAVGAGGGPGGAKIICAELYRQGLLDHDTFKADEAWGEILPAVVRDGYHLWARPVVERMRVDQVYSARIAALARPVAKTLASFMGHGRPSILGLVMLAVGLPVCALLGMIPKRAFA